MNSAVNLYRDDEVCVADGFERRVDERFVQIYDHALFCLVSLLQLGQQPLTVEACGVVEPSLLWLLLRLAPTELPEAAEQRVQELVLPLGGRWRRRHGGGGSGFFVIAVSGGGVAVILDLSDDSVLLDLGDDLVHADRGDLISSNQSHRPKLFMSRHLGEGNWQQCSHISEMHKNGKNKYK